MKRNPLFIGLASLALTLAALSPQTCSAQLFDDFTTDGGLNTNLWTSSSSQLTGLAAKYNSTLLKPTLSFDETGMTFSGVNGRNEIAGVQSLAIFQPPFTVTTTVTAGEAHGNAYMFFLASPDLSQWLAVSGNLNPGNGSYFGVWVNYNNSGLNTLGYSLYSDPGTNSQYTLQIFVETNGFVAVSLFSSNNVILGVLNYLDLGTDPFYLILGQREGGPNVVGPNIATWKNVSLISSAPAPVLAPATWTNGTLTLSWSAVAGATYQPQYTTALSPAQWNNLGLPVTAVGPLITAADASASDAQRFYRIVALP